VARLEDKLGQHSSDTAQINFDNCRIPSSSWAPAASARAWPKAWCRSATTSPSSTPTRRACAVLQDRLDLRGVAGNGIQPSVLRDAGAEDADMLIACAPQDETNLVACKVAHDVFNIPTTIARCAAPSSRRQRAAGQGPALRSTR
jgi:hypothetical protein